MHYIKSKIINIENNLIIVENNNIGYKGYLIDTLNRDLKIDNEVKLFYLNYRNEFIDESLFFIDENVLNLSKQLLQIKYFGIKTLNNLFNNISFNDLINYVNNQEIDKVMKLTNIKLNILKEVFSIVSDKILNKKYNKKQMEIINSLHKLGYGINNIYKVISIIDSSLDEELILQKALFELNEIKN
ncbi:hypothetical protein [Spiroplasma tabanidicola]|uniref:Holliday junction DNA helicase RuvA n=1 Tax=Spiroplasma tabanidicola TaxID=324079 RepID=A0A6I6C507_9MOLU|nr:hypothetical protein [Spiroplasma tabanidicola]QGS51917.1 Holliday junction DNA helicase RuvA [Spiroplasma tabanidicola]